MKNKVLNYIIKRVWISGIWASSVLMLSSIIFYRHTPLSELLGTGKQSTALLLLGISLVILFFTVRYIFIYWGRLNKAWGYDNIERFDKLVGEECTVLAIAKYKKHYQLYFGCKNKIYSVGPGMFGKELTENEKRLLRTHQFTLTLNGFKNIIVEPDNDKALKPGYTHHKILYMEQETEPTLEPPLVDKREYI